MYTVHSRHYIQTLHRGGSMILAGGGLNLSNRYNVKRLLAGISRDSVGVVSPTQVKDI